MSDVLAQNSSRRRLSTSESDSNPVVYHDGGMSISISAEKALCPVELRKTLFRLVRFVAKAKDLSPDAFVQLLQARERALQLRREAIAAQAACDLLLKPCPQSKTLNEE